MPSAFSAYQHTLKASLSIAGVGLHSGQNVQLHLLAAPIDHGVEFVRRMPDGTVQHLKPNALCVVDAFMCSNLQQGAMRVMTVEHLLSAFAACALDNVIVELTSEEIPIMDGSSQGFAEKILHVGLTGQSALRKYIQILAPVSVTQDDKRASLMPLAAGQSNDFVLDFSIDFAHPRIQQSPQQCIFGLASGDYLSAIAPARTFGFMRDVKQLHAQGLALGGGLHNAVVLDDSDVLNPEGLRFADEFVRHKILDALGDLYIIGHPIIGCYQAYKSGHALNNQLLKQLLAQPECWRFVTLPS